MAKEDCVDVQIRNVPRKLLSEFEDVVVKPNHPGGRSEAIRDLMRRAIQEQRAKGGVSLDIAEIAKALKESDQNLAARLLDTLSILQDHEKRLQKLEKALKVEL